MRARDAQRPPAGRAELPRGPVLDEAAGALHDGIRPPYVARVSGGYWPGNPKSRRALPARISSFSASGMGSAVMRSAQPFMSPMTWG